MQTKSEPLPKQNKVYYKNLHQLQQSMLETLIQVNIILLTVLYLTANLLGESINLPQLSISLILAVVGSFWALRWYLQRLVVAITIWMIGLAAMMGLLGYFWQRPELLLILLPLCTIGVLVVDWWYGIIVVAFLFLETWLLGNILSIGPTTLTALQIIFLGGLIGVIVGWAISRSLLMASSWAVQGYLRAQIKLDEAQKIKMELKQIQEDLLHSNREHARLTERLKVLHQVAEEARQIKEQFVANVSHELRTPLNMIISFSEMIMQSPRSYGVELPPELLADISAIQRNSRHLSKLVNDVLSLSQIEAGRMALTREWASLPEIIEEAVIAVGALYTSKNIYLETDLPTDLLPVFCDSTRIRQVVLNLLSNAGRYTDKGGVRINASQDDEEILVQVTDTGPGIAPENQDMVFQPFQQLDGLVQRRYGSSGLGLSISKNFVEMHGGRLWFESEQGVGTSFYLSLPIIEPVEFSHQTGEAKRWFNPYESYEVKNNRYSQHLDIVPRYVVLEESRVLTGLIERFVNQVEVINVHTIEEALVEIERSPAQAFLINEAAISSSKGLDRQIAHLPYGTPVISCWLASDDDAARELGATHYLVKPIDREHLLRVITAMEKDFQTILIVDDNPEALQLFARMLDSSDRDYRVLQADNARRGLDLLKSRQPDLLLLDLILPDMDGFELLQIKSLDPKIRDIPTIIISSQDPAGEPIVTDAIKVRRSDGLSVRELLTSIQAFSEILTPLSQPTDPKALENRGG
ncbi:MAG: hybrid sensor histidine kinase/response regulator [Chloroflexota bacterium]